MIILKNDFVYKNTAEWRKPWTSLNVKVLDIQSFREHSWYIYYYVLIMSKVMHIDWICRLYCAQVRLPVDFSAGQRMKVNIPHGFPKAYSHFNSNLADACICIMLYMNK